MEKGDIIEENNRKVKGKKNWNCAATLSEIYPSTCLTWMALSGVLKSSKHSYPGHWGTPPCSVTFSW